jgi:DNA-binding CsgD family transcriptional regulator
MSTNGIPMLNADGQLLGYRGADTDITERKRVQDALEENERPLAELNEKLEAERALLREKNLALRELLNHIEEERSLTRTEVLTNKERVLTPLLQSIKRRAGKELAAEVDAMTKALDEIVSPFANSISRKYASLSPREVEVCAMIKSGLMSKEIADRLYVSIQTVHKFRQRIRKKLGINKVAS